MLPTWSYRMLVRAGVLATVVVGLAWGAWLVNDSFGQGSEGPAPEQLAGDDAERQPADRGQPSPPAQDKKTEAKTEAQAGDRNAQAKVITLHEAISIVEKADRGEVVKGEKRGSGADVQFELEVLGKNGRGYLSVSANGRVILEKPAPADPVDPAQGKVKGKKKGGKKKRNLEGFNPAAEKPADGGDAGESPRKSREGERERERRKRNGAGEPRENERERNPELSAPPGEGRDRAAPRKLDGKSKESEREFE